MQSDLEAFLSPRKAAEAFDMLDRDSDGRLTLVELRSSIEEIFRCNVLNYLTAPNHAFAAALVSELETQPALEHEYQGELKLCCASHA